MAGRSSGRSRERSTAAAPGWVARDGEIRANRRRPIRSPTSPWWCSPVLAPAFDTISDGPRVRPESNKNENAGDVAPPAFLLGPGPAPLARSRAAHAPRDTDDVSGSMNPRKRRWLRQCTSRHEPAHCSWVFHTYVYSPVTASQVSVLPPAVTQHRGAVGPGSSAVIVAYSSR